ncbi:MAG: TIGR02270 family protein [Pseudolabrys sp.]
MRARALQSAGELGRRDLLPGCGRGLQDQDPACRFWAARSAVLLGNREQAVKILEGFVLLPNPFRGRALGLLLKVIDLPGARQLLKNLAQEPAAKRLLIQGTGMTGDPQYLPWLIAQMADDTLTRLAGESFSMITGLDPAFLDLERKPLEQVETGPSEDPNDDNVEMDPDDSLPWPDATKIQAWWQANQAHCQQGVRYFMGERLSVPHCRTVLREGFQRQRLAAADYLCLLEPGAPLFNVKAPAWRQLDKMA